VSPRDGLGPRLAPELLRVVGQPVLEKAACGGFVPHYVEFLSRGPAGTNLEPAGVLFEYARRKNQEVALDRACIQAALATVPLLPPDVLFSVNVHAATLETDPDFPRFLADLSGDPSRVVLEIVEHAPAWASHTFAHALASLRLHGIAIALDDVGVGQASYRMILDCDPDYLKVDRYIVSGCSADPRRRAVLESVVTLASRISSRVVAEGIETEEDLAVVEELGITLVQGYLLARPAPVTRLAEELPGWQSRCGRGAPPSATPPPRPAPGTPE
jgi:EAL domain-containing protein (putative c-di-GMP-specific phosphodiesterase class I)